VKHRKSLSSLAAVPLLVAAIAAPAAVGQPIDMHSSTVHKPAAQQDLRMEGSKDTSRAPVAKQDLRMEGSKDTSRAPELPAGVPTWPVNPRPLTPVAQQPAADGIGDGDGIDWPVSILAIGGALLLAGSLGIAGVRYRASHTHVTG
jgi:hypothetical protein